MKPTPSATTKTLEEIVGNLRDDILLADPGVGMDYEFAEARVKQDALVKDAVAAINNYITQRVIEELQGFSSGHLTNSGHKYLTKRYESLKGGKI